MLARHHLGQLAASRRHAPAFGQLAQQAQVMAQGGKTHRQRGAQAGTLVQHQQQVQARVDFGQQPGQRATVLQHAEHARRCGLQQAGGELLPDPLGHQVVGLAGLHHLAHQLQGLGRHREVGKARCQPGHPQDAHRVFPERQGDMAKHPLRQIGLSAPGVDHRIFFSIKSAVSPYAACLYSYRIDSNITPRQILLQRHIRRGMHGKAVVARPGLALGAGQRIFLMGLRVQKHREIAPHRQVALRQQLLGRGPHHHPVAVFHRQAQQGIPDCAAN